MRRTLVFLIISLAVTVLFNHSTITARELVSLDDSKVETPLLSTDMLEYALAMHDVGNMRLVVSNYGVWGDHWYLHRDYFTGEPLPIGSEYPKGSDIKHLMRAKYWIGGIIGSDTLVSKHGNYYDIEFRPTDIFGVAMEKISGDTPLSNHIEQPVSSQDIIAKFTDTAVDYNVLDFLRQTPHIPLNVEVTQKTYAWPHSNVDDFILFDVTVKNIGDELIKELYFGVESTPWVMVNLFNEDEEFNALVRATITGFIDEAPSHLGCGIVDTLKMMWGADFDGRPVDGEFTNEVYYDSYWEMWIKSATSAHGIFFLDYPNQNDPRPATLSYNWYWTAFGNIDFGPRHREDYRDFKTGGLGYPNGDANAYHVLSNGEIDYDFLYTPSITQTDPIWLPPLPDMVDIISFRGPYNTEHSGSWLPNTNVLSVGPFDVAPGASLKIPFVFVCGENFHTDPTNMLNLPNSTDQFYDNLNFSHLFENASWAQRVYDNPGYDTDGDEYAGEFTVCEGDTIYYTGDGIPDWRATMPPPAPSVWLEPTLNGIQVRFNGTQSENEKDVFSEIVDFEGYRIYCGRDDRATSLALVTSYDKHDFNKYVLTYSGIDYKYRLYDIPFSLDSLRCLYGDALEPCMDTAFDPLAFSTSSPYIHPDFKDSVFYFQSNDYNASALGERNNIAKVYPDEPKPSFYHPDSIPEEAYTSDGLLKYYEYEFVINELLATVPYWINVTAFDFGDPDMNLAGLETSLTYGIQCAFPLTASDAAAGGNSNVYVYPNPYRIDADYRDRGFEGRAIDDRPDYRVRALNFGNLPPRCTIYIYSLDGDLIRELDHDCDPGDPAGSHDSWNMITRNTQMVVSGLYYWVVEAEDGSTQMGKFVIIM